MIIKNNINVFVLLLALFSAGNVLAQAQHKNNLVLNNDCSQVSVNYENNPNLTSQEKIERMDRALLHSLNKYEGCQNTLHTNSSAAAGGASGGSDGGSNDGAEGNQGSAGNAGSGTSSASSTMSGTDTPAAEPSRATASENSQQSKQSNQQGNQRDNNKAASQAGDTNADDAQQANQHAGYQQQRERIKGSGKIPGDIPAVDNDSVLEAQIRQAAMSENDPVIKARLWNEYRKYKGLPVRKP